eukprot:snap_masked-scaffold_11-processed-gene-8.22-mRNA-1 protein AED:1.00 eAED:1.00 QI:0/0/0/0/1/1/2/0/686
MNFKEKLAFWLVALGYISTAEGLKLWSLNDDVSVANHRNRRLENFEGKKLIEMNLSPRELRAAMQLDNNVVQIELPSETVECKLYEGNPLISEALAEQLPDLHLFSGSCGSNREVNLIFNTEKDAIAPFSASIMSPVENFYVDVAEEKSNKYMMYNTKEARQFLKETGQYEFKDEVIISEDYFQEGKNLRSLGNMEQDELIALKTEELAEKRKLQSSHTGYEFKLAILTSTSYSSYHGNTRTSVMQALTTTMSRVNGIYMREFGTYMQFVDTQTSAICLSGSAETGTRRSVCRQVPNTSSVINVALSRLNSLGVSSSTYDVGHAVTTGSGGLAAYPSVCRSNKASGTTGLSAPVGDVFDVDYVSHELGHQFFGAHSFRDCSGNGGNLMSEGAAEPGGGSSIMGYAGICGGNDIQANSDPYFNAAQLVPMFDYITDIGDSCGEQIDISPVINAPSSNVEVAGSCRVPVGNSFQLDAGGITSDGFYSWDRVDLGYEDLDSSTLGRFRSYKPTKATSRFFPNLYFQTFPGEANRDWEGLPTVSRSMTFRFTERTLYDTFEEESVRVNALLGEFQTEDVTVSFTTSLDELSFETSFSTVSAGSSYSVSYDADSSVGTVEFLVAENTIQEVNNFDYETDNVELNWISAGTGSNGSGVLTIPSSVDGEIAIMVRAGTDLCYYFDLITGVRVN